MSGRLFAKILINVTGPEATMGCQDAQLCARLKAGIDGAVYRVQNIINKNLTMKDWGILSVDAKMCSTRSIESECCGYYVIYGCMDITLSLTVIVTGHRYFCGMVIERPLFCTV